MEIVGIAVVAAIAAMFVGSAVSDTVAAIRRYFR